MTLRLTPAEIAAFARITEKHMRRVIAQFSRPQFAGGRRIWRGVALRIQPDGMVDFSSLPADVRDAALVASDQLALPLPPEHDKLEWRKPDLNLKGKDHG